MTFLRALIKLGFHGKRHWVSYQFININSYCVKQAKRDHDLDEWMHNNGLGV